MNDERITKIDDYRFRKTTVETVTKEQVLSIEDLEEQKARYQKSLNDYQAYAESEIAKIDELIARAKRAGVKQPATFVEDVDARGLYGV